MYLYLRRWLSLGACLVVGMGLLSIDLFGNKSISEAYSAYMANMMLGHFYPTHQRESITVVILNDEQIHQNCDVYPPSHEIHARFLERIVPYRPRAIFIDVLFMYERPGTDRFSEMLAYAQAEGIPVFLAASPNPGPYPALPTLAGQAALAAVRINPGLRESDLYCFASQAETSAACTGRGLPLERLAEGARFPSAAARLYDVACRPDDPLPTCRGRALAKNLRDDGFRVIWGAGAHPSQVDPATAAAELNRSRRALADLRLLEPETRKFFRTLPATALIGIKGDCADRRTPPKAGDLPRLVLDPPLIDELVESLSDRVVLYGMSVSGAADLLATPTHVAVEGVHWHAMALDNLMLFGSGYKADHFCINDRCHHATAYNLLVYLGLFGLACRLRFANWRLERVQPVGFWRNVAHWGGVWLFLLAATAFGFYLLDLAFVNWIGIAAFPILLLRVWDRFNAVWERHNEENGNATSQPPRVGGHRARGDRLAAIRRRRTRLHCLCDR